MANWNGSDGFKQQKKRNFVYKSAPQGKNLHSNPHNTERSALPTLQMTSVNSYSSPRKKMRSSYSFYDKTRSDQQAAEELCSDLPLDAFEDDVLDDFGDDFTAEELCQVADQTEQQAMTQTQNVTTDIAKSSPELSKQTIQGNIHGLVEDYFDDPDQDIDLVESERLFEKNNFNFSIPSKGREEEIGGNPNERTAILFSAESQSNSNFANVDCTFTNGVATVSNKVDQKFTEDLKLLEVKLAETQDKIKELEEQNYIKDGNLKMLQDSLEHLKAEEIKNKEKLRNVEEEKRAELKELQKNHAKTVEQLNSKICFQEQEIKQAKEQRQAKQLENNSVSPARTKPQLSSKVNIIPTTGQSFFEHNSADSRSPKARKFTKTQNSPEKIPLKITPKEEAPDTCRTSEKKLLRGKDVLSKTSNVEIAHRLLKLPNTELTDIGMKYESSSVNQSLLPLLRLNSNATLSDLGKIENGVGFQNTVVDQELLNSAILNSEFKSSEVCQAIEEIQELINTNRHYSTTHHLNLNLVNNFKASNFLDFSRTLKSAVKLLPLLESHISRYSELRLDKDDDSILNTCPSSPVGDTSDIRDGDSIAVLSLALDKAVQSLRCLAVLVSYSSEVCEVLLKSVKTQKLEKDEEEEVKIIENHANSSSNMVTDDLLSLLLQLAVPQPNEPSLISLASLGVLESLAEHCSKENVTGILSPLCDKFLPQCLSKEYCLNTLSSVVEILIKSLCGRHVCLQPDDCVLLKVYQGCLSDSVSLSHTSRINLQSKVVVLVDSMISSNNEASTLLDCHCTIELLKLLVHVLHKELNFLENSVPESIMANVDTSLSLQLLCCGVTLLANLSSFSKLLLADLHVLVGHKYISLIMGSLRLIKDKEIPGMKNATEMSDVLIDLLETDNIEYGDVFEDAEEDVDAAEDMEIGE